MIKDVIYKVEKISFTSKDLVAEIEKLIKKIKDLIDISEHNYYNIMVAVTEGINNAISHGNKKNSEKIIKVYIFLNSKQFAIKIKDEGKGFDIDNIKDPRSPDNLLKDNGRGVFLMRELSSNFKINSSNSGTTIEMIFNLE